MAQKDSIIKEYIEVTPRRIKRQWSLPMSELGDYRRLIEAPMIAKYEATIKDWQDSSEAYRRDAEVAETRLAEAVEALRWLRAFWKPGSNHDTAEVQLALSQADRVLGAVGRSPERGEQS